MRFLTEQDFSTGVNAQILNQIICGEVSRLDDAENIALSHIRSKLGDRYNLVRELSLSGEARNRNLIRWALAIAIYHLYNTVPDLESPERVRQNHSDTLKEIAAISSGKEGTDLVKLTEASGKKKTRFRWGSKPRRSHNPFN